MSGHRKTLRDLVRDYERSMVVQTLVRNNGNQVKTASALGITRRTLQKILERHHLLKRRYTKPLPIPVKESVQ